MVKGASTSRLARSLAAVVMFATTALACSVEPVTTVDPDLADATHDERLRARPTVRVDERPIRLVTRDGIDLPLLRLEVRGTVEDPLAFTELHMDFENGEPRELDATLRVELPADARVTRFAALIEGSWREAEVVERKPGHLRPSLFDAAEPSIDAEAGDRQVFEVQLPEVPRRSVQKIVLSYAETFDDDEDMYRLGLFGLRQVPRFSARVVVHGQAHPRLADYAGVRKPSELGLDERGVPLLDLVRLDWTPDDDLVVPTSGPAQTGVRNGRNVAVRVKPLTHDHNSPIDGLTILFDTSASQAIGYRERVAELERLVREVERWTGGAAPLSLIAFDQGFETIYEGTIGDIESSAFDRLRKRRALGASNLVSVLRHTAVRRGRTMDRVVLISDGKATAGVQGRKAVLDTVGELADGGIRRIDVIADLAHRDEWLTRNIVRQLPESGLVMDTGEGPRRLARRLVRTVHDDVQISVPGANWSHPDVVHGLQSDDEILVFADVPTGTDELRVIVDSHGKESWDVPLLDVEEPLVAWALAQARVDFLVATLEDKSEGQSLVARQQLWRKIVTSSREGRVVNAYTRLSMLADPNEYERANIDPSGLPDVLFAGPADVQRRVRGVPNALSQLEIPLARTRLPRFSQDTLEGEQLRLLADDARARTPSDIALDDGAKIEADLELLVGAVDGPRVVLDDLFADTAPLPETPADVELDRLRWAQPFVKRGRARAEPPVRRPEDAYHGNLLAIMNLLAWDKTAEAKQVALAWREAEPAEVMAVIALGETLEANAEIEAAARAYGSIIDLHPDRADMRRFAGSRLEHLGSIGGRLAIDTYRRAREQRPDHPSSHRLLAYSLLRVGRPGQAFQVLEAALERDWSVSFSGVENVLREDLGLAGSAWIADDAEMAVEVEARLSRAGAKLESEPSLRFVLTWETGANDVDLHVRDALGSHAYYDNRALRSGGVLQYDVTEGWGPEVFTVLGEPTGYPYNLQVHYYARGPNGFGMGKLQIVQHDGSGRLEFDERPFVVMKDRAYVDLGDLDGPLGKR